MNPLVSVIIPVHNGAEFIETALESVFAQAHRPLEVVVADDASTDATAALVESFPEVIQLLKLSRCGVSAARNAAVAASNGEWLAFLDADDLWLPDKLHVQLQAAGEHPDAAVFLGGKRIRVEDSARDWYTGPAHGEQLVSYEPSVWLVRRDAFERVGQFDTARTIGEDTDWIVRAKDAGLRVHVCPEVLCERRIHGRNATRAPYDLKGITLGILRDSVRRKTEARGQP
ncbi:MAG: glycosyltransferase family 2 protein [Dehalococcoidia bacterium]|nr:glycosyltransferase family 2 protein [Dehalococcoidia bacterium]